MPEGVLFTRPANEDLVSILSFVMDRDAAAAERLLSGLERATSRLARHPQQGHPKRGHRRPDFTGDADLRFLGVGDFLVVYRVNSSPLEILRILHGSQDLTAPLEASP